MTTTTDTTTASDTVERLRTVTALLDAHPDLPRPVVTVYTNGTTSIAWYLDRDDDQLDEARRIRRVIGGVWDKATSETMLYLRQYRDGIELSIGCARDVVCRRIVTGTTEVTIPAVEAQPERTETRETYDWECAPILTADGAA